MKTSAEAAKSEALKITRGVLERRFAGCSFAIASGSIFRGKGREHSDVDLVVVFDKLNAAWRESFLEDNLPFEAFVHDPETLTWFFECDFASGYPLIVHMVAAGQVLGEDAAQGEAWQAHARKLLDQGPPQLSAPKLDAMRYQITNLLDDLRDERSVEEIRAITAQLYQPLADLMLLGRGRWSGKGKWIPRLLQAVDEGLLNDFDSSFAVAMRGNAQELVEFAKAELARMGGPYFHGDRREAPATARRAPPMI